ncbi:multiple RNA-binding domain-containing protein 1 [Senna tora]|uniref:Multiple RNA-binding domain-containing protein 1 n=1 Tax=Senna tora TaxID=362788 RepID=A0A834U4K5_9FABA|nr:multiple RNA-binding domain-containing protein 1 [Senna tora]
MQSPNSFFMDVKYQGCFNKSRICVKNLPKYVAEDRLRELFSQKGEITDVQLRRTEDGKSRQFGYIGFYTEHEAEEAIKYFNRSYLDTHRITCEVALKVGDPNIPRSRSRYSLKKDEKVVQDGKKHAENGSVAKEKRGGENVKESTDIDDPQLQEFLQVTQPRAKSKMWANDTLAVLDNISVKQEIPENRSKDISVPVDAGVQSGSLDDGSSNKHISNKTNDLVHDDVISDMEYFKSRVTKKCEDELEEHFSKIGSVSQVHLVVDKDTKRSKGIAYILYTLPEFAARALEELDNSIFQGRLLYILPAMQRSSDNKENHSSMDQNSKSLKQKREEERKAAEASGDTRSWNSLFMRSDTVVENIARKYGVSKSDLLDREADDLAVRIALGETQVIAETKKALTNAGVNVESLEEFSNGKNVGVKRSNHVLLVKNLPYGSSENELAKMFGKFGGLDKIILPPTKTLALVVYLETAEARAVFRGLAYKRFKDAPLYLEWAPSNVLIQSLTSKNNEKSGAIGEKDVKRQMLEKQWEGISDMDIDHDRVEGTVLDGQSNLQLCHAKKDGQVPKTVEKDKSPTKLSVKNVAFEATKKELRQLFSPFGQIKSLRLPMKFGSHSHRGFAFVEYVTQQEAQNALKALSSTHLYGRHLVIERAKKDDESLDELRARTGAQFSDEQNGFQNPTKLSKKRNHLAILD